MIKLFTEQEFKEAKSTEKLKLRCEECGTVFLKKKSFIQAAIKGSHSNCSYCSNKCVGRSMQSFFTVSCEQCGKLFTKQLTDIKRTNHDFCSKSCSCSYSNAHKTSGQRRSKLEAWLEHKLTSSYSLHICFNTTDAIGYELDIFIPSLMIAFELNGIFHYEPIFGSDKLLSTRINDSRKFYLCQEKGISLCIIDTSGQKYFKESTSFKYLQIITDIINERLTVP